MRFTNKIGVAMAAASVASAREMPKDEIKAAGKTTISLSRRRMTY
jgi:hypothetical protein